MDTSIKIGLRVLSSPFYLTITFWECIVSVNRQGAVILFILVIPFEIVEKLGLKLRKSIGYVLYFSCFKGFFAKGRRIP